MLKLYVVWANRHWDFGKYRNPYTLMIARDLREVDFRSREWAERTVKWREGKRPFAGYYTVCRDTIGNFIARRLRNWITSRV